MITIIEYVMDYFTRPKQDVLLRGMHYLDMIMDHLVMLILFPNSRDQNHWKKEIINFLMYSQRPKIKNRIKIKQDEYFDILFDQPIEPKEPYFDSYLWLAIRDILYDEKYKNEYSEFRKNYHSVDENLCDLLYDKIKKFMWNISFYMSKKELNKQIIEQELEKYIEN